MLALLYQNQSLADIKYGKSLPEDQEKAKVTLLGEQKFADVMKSQTLKLAKNGSLKFNGPSDFASQNNSFKDDKNDIMAEFEESLRDAEGKGTEKGHCDFLGFIHDKHEAFKFKYEPTALKALEKDMDRVTVVLYINAVIYYMITFGCPFYFAYGCGLGINEWSHIIYSFYSIVNLISEIMTTIWIQRKVKHTDILKLNKWHAVECLMG